MVVGTGGVGRGGAPRVAFGGAKLAGGWLQLLCSWLEVSGADTCVGGRSLGMTSEGGGGYGKDECSICVGS